MNPVIDSQVQRGAAGAGVNGHINVLCIWISLSEHYSVWSCKMHTDDEGSIVRRWKVRCCPINFNSEWEGRKKGERSRGSSSQN